MKTTCNYESNGCEFEGEKHEQIQLTSQPWTRWACVHSPKHQGQKLLYQFSESFCGRNVWLFKSELKLFEFHYFFPAIWNWPNSLSIFIIFSEEISEEISIKKGLILIIFVQYMTLLLLCYDLVRVPTIPLPQYPPNLGHFLKQNIPWMLLKFMNYRQSHQRFKLETEASQWKYSKGLDNHVWARCDNEDKTKTWGTCQTIDSDALKTSFRDANQCDLWSWSLKIVVLEEMYVA